MRLGASGERLAAHWRCVYGEADTIAERTGELIFVEAQTWRGDALGAPEEAVTATKLRKLIATAQTYLMEHGAEERPCRSDVTAVQ
jgi:putative endonuclease